VAVRDGLASTVPVLIGTTRDESRYWLLYYDYLDRLPLSYSQPWLDAISGGRSTQINDAFLIDRPDLTDGQLMMATATSSAFTMPAIRFAEALSSRGSPVWMYQFTVPSNQLDGRMGSPHAMDLPFMFGNLDAEPALLDPSDSRADYEKLAAVMQDAWIAFARTGDPSTAALGNWPGYDEAARETMMFDIDSGLAPDPFAVERTVWGDIPFDGLTPPLRESNPLTASDTQVTIPVVVAVIGPVWTTVIIVAALALIVGVVVGIVWLVRRRRRKRAVEALGT
jgi:para-nitrobenzyl esterase